MRIIPSGCISGKFIICALDDGCRNSIGSLSFELIAGLGYRDVYLSDNFSLSILDGCTILFICAYFTLFIS